MKKLPIEKGGYGSGRKKTKFTIETKNTSGNKSGFTYELNNVKNEPLKREVTVRSDRGSFVKKQTFPKGTLISNLPGGLMAKVPGSKDKFGESIQQTKDNMQKIANALNG